MTQCNKYCYSFPGWQLRQRLHWTGSVWNRYEIGTDKPCVYTRPGGSGTDRICCLVPNGSTYEGDPIWNHFVPVLNRSHVNRVDPCHSGSDPKRIWTYPIPCKRSLWVYCINRKTWYYFFVVFVLFVVNIPLCSRSACYISTKPIVGLNEMKLLKLPTIAFSYSEHVDVYCSDKGDNITHS